MSRVEALLLLGANVGPRRRNLGRAVARLRRVEGVEVTAVSAALPSASHGISGPDYLNLAVKIHTTRTALGLLIEGKILEAAAGRRSGKRWGPRPLDIDLITFGNRSIRNPWLIVPHPRTAERAFALRALAQVVGRRRLGRLGLISSLLRRLEAKPRK